MNEVAELGFKVIKAHQVSVVLLLQSHLWLNQVNLAKVALSEDERSNQSESGTIQRES